MRCSSHLLLFLENFTSTSDSYFFCAIYAPINSPLLHYSQKIPYRWGGKQSLREKTKQHFIITTSFGIFFFFLPFYFLTLKRPMDVCSRYVELQVYRLASRGTGGQSILEGQGAGVEKSYDGRGTEDLNV
jgi:hypothetical protein